MFQFVLTFLAAAVTVSGVAVAWPKFTSEPRPGPLEKVHEIVKDTAVGKNIASVLGVSEDVPAEPVNIASMASTLKDQIAKAAQDRAQHIVVTQAMRQLASQFDQLPQADREQIQQLICIPATESATNE